jgi:hypothetical protein
MSIVQEGYTKKLNLMIYAKYKSKNIENNRKILYG